MRKQNLRRPLLIAIGFLFLGIITIVACAFLLFQYIKRDLLMVDWGTPVQHHTVPDNPYFQEMWTQSIFADCMTCVTVAEESAYFVGTLQSRGLMSLSRLDLLTGEVQWQTTLPSARAGLLTNNSQYILVAVSGGKVASPTQSWDTAQVIAYDRFSGEQAWSQRIPGTRGIGTAYFIGDSDRVSVFGGYDRAFQLAAETGKILDETRHGLLASHDEQVDYFLEFEGIRAVNAKTGETLWFQEVPIYPPPQFVEEFIIVGGGERNLLGSAVALDRRNGNVLWEYEKVISNIAVSDSTVFFLKVDENEVWGREVVSDVQLLAVDMETGTVIASMRFEPPGLTSGSGKFLYNVVAHDNIVLVHLADGSQLIALRFSPGE